VCSLCKQLRRLVDLYERLTSVSNAKEIANGGGGNKHVMETDDGPSTTRPGSSDVMVSNDVNNDEPDTSSSPAAAATSAVRGGGSVERLLAAIHDLLATRLRSDAELRHEMTESDQLARQWMTAAAVVDRVCFVVLAMILVAGSAVFLFLLIFF